MTAAAEVPSHLATVVESHGLSIQNAATIAYQTSEGSRKVRVVALQDLMEKVKRAAVALWEIDSNTRWGQQAGWSDIYHLLWQIPVLLVALERAIEDPEAQPFGEGVGDSGGWCAGLARDISEELLSWSGRRGEEASDV